jgi:uncharacterized membrane protein YqjE
MRPRPIEALRRVSARTLELLQSRVELAALELEQARAQWVRWAVLSLVCSVMFQLALLAASAALAVMLWDRFGPLTLAAIALAYAGIGAAILARLRREIAAAPVLLARTLAELAKDREALFGDDAPSPPGAQERGSSGTTQDHLAEARAKT